MKSLVRSLALSALVLALAAPAFAQGTSNSPNDTTTMRTSRHRTSSRMHRHGTMEKTKKVDLNTASAEELKELPGVDQAMADKIIAGRPYTSARQLETKHILTRTEYNKVRNHVWAKGEKSEKKMKTEGSRMDRK